MLLIFIIYIVQQYVRKRPVFFGASRPLLALLYHTHKVGYLRDVRLEITGVSQVEEGEHHHQTSLFTPEYCCIPGILLCFSMRFDDVCWI